jgi:metal-sulfur cluster biosynthetic enzyme
MLPAAPLADRTSAVTAAVRSALGGVRDPELDEAVTELGFVSCCEVDEQGTASVRLRLPTYFCAPNFAYLMVADAFDAVSGVAGVSRAEVVLEDHFAADVINAGVAARAGFATAFAGEAVGELDGLRADFLRRAVLAGTDRVCRPMLAGGMSATDLAGLTLGDIPASGELRRLRSRREELGLPCADDSPLLIDPATGAAVAGSALSLHLGRARLARVGAEVNGAVCRGLLHERYPDTSTGTTTSTGTSTGTGTGTGSSDTDAEPLTGHPRTLGKEGR